MQGVVSAVEAVFMGSEEVEGELCANCPLVETYKGYSDEYWQQIDPDYYDCPLDFSPDVIFLKNSDGLHCVCSERLSRDEECFVVDGEEV